MADPVQVRVKKGPEHLRQPRHILAEGKVQGGDVFWTTPENARAYIDQGIVEFVGAAPGEARRAGPAESKPTGPAEKKSFAAGTDGPSTDSASSSQSATAAPSSASPEDPASQPSNARGLRRGGRGPKTGE